MNGRGWPRRWDPFREFQQEVGRLFDSLEPLHEARLTRQFPPINLYDAGDRYILTAPVPGMSPEELDLSITGETLTFRGERQRSEGVLDESFRRQERPLGRWTRTVTLPDRVEGGQVSASYALGVLTVSLPKSEGARPRKIPVGSGA